MNSVFFSIALSLDGYMVPKDMDFAHADNLAEQPWFRQWSALTQWIFRQRFFREMLRIGEGGETGRDNDLLESVFARTGASIMGKRMFDGTGTLPITLTETIASTDVTHLRYTVNG